MSGNGDQLENNLHFSMSPDQKVLHSYSMSHTNNSWKYFWYGPMVLLVLGLAVYGVKSMLIELKKPKNRRAVYL